LFIHGDRVGRTDIISCGVGEHHAACVTSAGQVLIAGRNSSGEVDPDRRDEKIIAKPMLLESLSQARIVQVSCGFNHTAALRSNGAVLTWGSNEFGQLGHLDTSKTAPVLFCRPAIMALGAGRHATAVACGDGFTLCLTSRMSVLACGVKDITGFGPEELRHLPAPIPALEDLPLVGIAAGRRHAVVITAHGSAFGWGDNHNGQCGREYPKMLLVPVPIKPPMGKSSTAGKLLPPPLTNWAYRDERPGQKHEVLLADDIAVVNAACGADHTVLVTRSGRLLVCGSNNHGQIGLDRKIEKTSSPQPIEHPCFSRYFVRAVCGDIHTLLLDNVRDLWQMGGTSSAAGCTQLLIGKEVRFIGAGGEQSVAVTVVPAQFPLRSEVSDTVSNQEELQLADCVEELIDDLRDDKMATGDVEPLAGLQLTKITNRVEFLFRTPAVLNSLFMDPTELEDLFSKLLSVDLRYRQTIVSAIEKGILQGLATLRTDDARLMWPEQVRFLLLYLQCPMFVEWKREGSVFDRRGDLILSLCETILGIPYEGYTALMCWATSIYPEDLFVRFLIRPLLSQLKKGLSVEAGAERRPIPAIVTVLRWLHSASERAGNIVAPENFYSDAVSQMHPEMLYNDLERFKNASKQQRVADFFFCDNPFLFSPSTKRNLLQMENEMNMLKTAASGLTYNPQEQTFEFNPFYVLNIDREYLLTQTLQKISQAKPSDLRKKLRVVFKGEDGVDGKS
jgi:alpha-tubulin suppressor-like RCC1 family protein